MRLIDLRDTSRERACIDCEPHPFPNRINGRLGYRFAKTEVVDDNVHRVDAIAWSGYLFPEDIPEHWPRRTLRLLDHRPAEAGAGTGTDPGSVPIASVHLSFGHRSPLYG